MSAINDPGTPDMTIQEAMAELANELVGAYMRAADAAITPEEEEEAVTKMRRAWKIKNDRTMNRELRCPEVSGQGPNTMISFVRKRGERWAGKATTHQSSVRKRYAW